MSKKRTDRGTGDVGEMRAEYRFDYTTARPNPYAARLGNDTVTVVLDPDVAAVFHSSESVNQLLRSVIAAIPARTQGRDRKKAG